MKTNMLILAFAAFLFNGCDGTTQSTVEGGTTETTVEPSTEVTTEDPQVLVLYVDEPTATTETTAESTTDGTVSSNVDIANVDYGKLALCKDPSDNTYCLSFSKDSTGLGSDSKIFTLNKPVKFVVKYRKVAKEKLLKKAH